MSERWRNELRKLRRVEPPDDLRARVDRAPTDEPLPANRQRVIAGVVAFALFAASGAFAWRALSPQGGPADVGNAPPELVIDVPARDGQTPGHATARFMGLEQEVPGRLSSWEGIVIPERFPTALAVGTLMSLQYDGPQVSIQATRCSGWNVCDGPVQDVLLPFDGPAHLPADLGIYSLNFLQPAPAGSDESSARSWALQVQLVPDGVPAVTFMRDRFQPNALPTGFLLWDGRLTALRLGADTSVALGPAPPTFDEQDFLSVPVGSSLVTAGDAGGVDGSIGPPQPPYTAIESLEEANGAFPLNLTGRFVLSFDATWYLRTAAAEIATFYLPVEVVPAGQTPVPTVVPTAIPPGAVAIAANAHATSDPNDPIEFSFQMQVDGVDVPGASGGFQTDITYLDGTGSSAIGDAAYPNFKPTDYIAIPAGSPLVLETNATVIRGFASAGATPFEGSQPIVLRAGVIPDLPLGKHVLQINATWTFGPTALFDRAETSAGMSFPIEIVPGSAQGPAPSVLRVDCSANPVVSTSVVAAVQAGVRVRFADRASEQDFDLTWASPNGQPADVHGPIPGSAVLDLPIPPGHVSVRCTGGDSTQVSIVDPHGLWTSPVVACQETQQIEAIGPLTLKVPDYEISVRRLLTLRETDEVRSPNYPGTLVVSMLPAHAMVVRDGVVVAALEIWADRIDGAVCAGSGIGPRP